MRNGDFYCANVSSACATPIISLSSSYRHSVAASDHLFAFIYYFRKPILKYELLATVPFNSELGVWQRIKRVRCTYSCRHEHKLNHVI
jgi:hypothetical protein